MKRINIIIISLLLFVPLITTLFAANLFSKSEVKVASAATGNSTYGVYEKISAGDLKIGDTILLVSYQDDATFVDEYTSNPRVMTSITFDNTNSYFSDTHLYVNSCNAEELIVGSGAIENSYTFKGTSSFNNKYLKNCFDETYQGLHPSSSLSNYAYWKFIGDGYCYHLQCQGGDKQYIRHTYISSYGFNLFDMYGATSSETEFVIYRKLTIKNASIEHNMNKTTYYVGDAIDLSGFEIAISYDDGSVMGDYVYLTYDEAPNFFSLSQSSATKTMEYVQITTAFGNFANEINVIDNPNHIYTKLTSPLMDYRGTYLVVFEKEDGTGYIWDTTLDYEKINEYDNFKTVNIVNGQIIGPTSNIESLAIKIETHTDIYNSTKRVFNNLKLANGKYLTTFDVGEYFSHVEFSDVATYSNRVTFSFSRNHNVYVADSYPISMFYYGDYQFTVYENDLITEKYLKCSFYKLEYNDEIEEEIASFTSKVDLNTKDVCDHDGVDTDLNTLNSNWSVLANEFDMLSVDAQGYLANMTYTHDAEIPGSTADIIDRYDYIISKYDQLSDFMNRKGGAYANYYTSNLSTLTSQFVKQNNVIIIVIVSASLLLASSAVFVITKKKAR